VRRAACGCRLEQVAEGVEHLVLLTSSPVVFPRCGFDADTLAHLAADSDVGSAVAALLGQTGLALRVSSLSGGGQSHSGDSV
jgi:hypothetical protein